MQNSLIFTDVHGMYYALIELLQKAGCKIENDIIIENPYSTIINNGDSIDKGPDSIKVINFLYKNRDKITNISGNHERFCLLYRKGEIKEKDPYILSFFDSINIQDENFWTQLEELFGNSSVFFEGPNFIVTHSPCDKKYLGKSGGPSEKNQRNWRYAHLTEDEIKKQLDEWYKDDNSCYPTRIFGHISFKKPYCGKSFIGLDTGACYGNVLTAVKILPYGKREFISVKTENQTANPEKIFSFKEKDVNFDHLEKPERHIINSFLRNKVNFISGTMCPADKTDDSLEDLNWALDYYFSNGVDRIVLQPKYMGSRANVYLFSEAEQCYTITRRGFRAQVDLTAEYKRLIELFKSDFENGLKVRILDAELLPWSILGQDLIDKLYYNYYWLLKQQREFRATHGFYDTISKLKSSMKDEYKSLNKKDFIKQHGHHIYDNYNASTFLNHVSDIDPEPFKTQIDLYGQKGEPYIRPFSILKDVYEDKEIIRLTTDSNWEVWKFLQNTDKICRVNQLTRLFANEFFENLTVSQGYEGVVVKPEFHNKDLAPALKVRNPEYLRLIYGPDYTVEHKLNKLRKKKYIKKKLAKSINDFRLGVKLLGMPYTEIDRSNQEYINTVSKFVVSERRNNELDPRL